MRRKVFSIILSVLFMCLIFSGCKNSKNKEGDAGPINQVSSVVTKDGVTYIEVEGKPYTYTGIQLRTDAYMNCEYKSAEDLDDYFRLASDLNINTIQLPIDWNDIEVDFDKYDYSVVETFLNSAKKYNLKVEFLWFSTNMCGETHSYHIPAYIIDDPVTYPRYDSEYTGRFWKYYGYIMHLEFGNDNLLEREVKVVKNLMNFVYKWNKNNGNPNTLIGVQVHNEPDCFPLYRVENHSISVKKNGVQITAQEAKDEVNKALNTVGNAFKSSKYKIYTRVNFALANEMNDYIKSVFDLEGIDIVGDDPHEPNVATMEKAINEYSLAGNYPHIAENRANFSNTNSLMLTTFANGGGYIMYEVSTSNFFIQYAPPETEDPDYGIYTSDLGKRDFTDGVGRFAGMLNNSGYAVVTAGKDKFHAFNIENNSPSKTYEKTITVSGNEIKFKTEKSALGYIIEQDGYLIVASDKSATISGVGTATVEQGKFTDGVWEVLNANINVSDGSFKTGRYNVYKITL